MKSAADALLFQLKSRGEQSAATLAAALAITPMGAHKQLQQLLEQGLVSSSDHVDGPGRPKRLWRLTATGHGRFPDRHGELALQLIEQTAALFGPEGLERLIAAREASVRDRYLARLATARGLAERLRRLCALRAEEGYMARLERDGPDWLLVEDHCPICAAASACQGFCRSELALFQYCLGKGVAVRRDEHLLAGARRCAYRVKVVHA
ncbi:transcriptional regulator [Paucibacter sp. APW11]|uniref:Transcriptional regulator n=1 Tax=Roseateles aquae TaxID=3077235 RepID=A0ABU3P8Y5_9BURK|nr:transcriptional regulator [Paucibacter sp. APW11]MDT8999033.1 transcriptional regulator [Paucibacter sp. APW11]